MRAIIFAVIAVLLAGTVSAAAGPVGVYDVVGTNPGSGTPYRGVVEVRRNGATYTVVWRVGGTRYIGTGVGAADVDGTMTFGNAARNDTAIAVSYATSGSFGLALYSQQRDGTWKGIWAYGGATAIGTETWIPRR